MRPLFQSSLDRRGKATGRWLGATLLMVAAHIGGGAAGYIYWGTRPTELIVPPATVISFELAPLPVAPPPPQKIEEPEPEIDPIMEPPPPISELDLIPPAPPEVKVAVAVPEKPKPIKKKKKKEQKKKKKKPVDKKPEPQPELPPNDFKNTQDAPSPTTHDVPAQLLPTAPVAAGPTQDELARIGQATIAWELSFQKHIKKYRKYPKSAKRKNQTGSPGVEFVFDRQGNVLSVRLIRSSGVEALDNEAVAMFQRASPLPPLPAEIEGEQLFRHLQIDFTLKD